MDLLTSWRALRAAWGWLLGALVVGAVVGYLLPAPTIHGPAGSIGQATEPGYGHWSATATVGVPPTSNSSQAATRVSQVAFYAQITPVVDGTLTRLGVPLAQAPLLAKVLRLQARTAAGQLQITGIGADADQAAAVANAFSDSLQGRVAAVQAMNQAASLRAATALVARTKSQLDAATTALAALGRQAFLPTSAAAVDLRVRIAALQAEYQAAIQTQGTAQNSAADGQDLLVSLQDALPRQATYTAPVAPTTGKHWFRAVLGAVVALAAAVLLLLAAEYRRPRLRTRAGTELAVGAPVIVELPRLRRTPADVAVRLAPSSRSAEAYRMLRTVLLARAATARPESAVREAPRAASWSALTQSLVLPADGAPLVSANGAGPHVSGAVDLLPAGGTGATSGIDRSGGGERDGHAPSGHALDASPVNGTAVNGTAMTGHRLNGHGPNGHGPIGHGPGRPVADGAAEPAFRWWRGQIVFLARPDEESSLPTVAANIAAAVAETGRSVIVLRTRSAAAPEVVHLDGPPEPQPTAVPRVSVVEIDPRGGDDLRLTASVRQLAARADVVLIEGGSVLTEHTTASLAPLAEAVVLTLEADRSTAGSARDAARTLRRLGVPLRGVVLCGVAERHLAGRHGRRRRLPALRRG